MHSSRANGDYRAATISRRHQAWGYLRARHGYFALLVDGFGPRGYPEGFPRFSYDRRPHELDEVTVRPLDAYGALLWLRSQTGVAPTRSSCKAGRTGQAPPLAAMAAREAPGLGRLAQDNGFRAALALHPACALKGRFPDGLLPYAPVRVFHGTADDEVSARRCAQLVDASRKRGADFEIVLYLARSAASTTRDAGVRAKLPTRQRRPMPRRRRWPSWPKP